MCYVRAAFDRNAVLVKPCLHQHWLDTSFSISSQQVLPMRCFFLTVMCKHIKHILIIKNTNKNLDWNGSFLRLDFLARFSISSCTSLVALVRIFFHRLRLLTPEGLIFRPLPFWSLFFNTSITTFCASFALFIFDYSFSSLFFSSIFSIPSGERCIFSTMFMFPVSS